VSDTALFTPFRGEHYADPASLERRLAPPYDVIGPAERERLAARDDANIVRVDLPVAPEGEDPYRLAARLLGEWRARGLVVRDGSPSAYVLRTTSTLEGGATRRRTGAFLALAAEPFGRGRVKPHEQTHKGPKEDRRRLTHATATNLSPIFVLAPDEDGRLAALLAEVVAQAPWARARAADADHEIWLVSGAAAGRIADAASAASVYIADGHHRYETAVTIRSEAPEEWRAGARRTLAHVVSFKDHGLEILPTHRIVPGAPAPREAVIERAVTRWFERCDASRAVLTLVCADGAQVPLAPQPQRDLSKVPGLPGPWAWGLPSWMCDNLLVGVCAADLVGAAPAFRYTASAAEARSAAREPGVAFTVLLRATTLEEVKTISDLGQVMPPKSTFFAPKVPTGVVLRPLGGESA